MPNVGFGELMVLVLVALIVFGPERLPEMARNVGKFVRSFQRETSRALSDLKEGLEPMKAGVFDEPDPLGLGSFMDSDAPNSIVSETDGTVVGDAATTELAVVPPTSRPATAKRSTRAKPSTSRKRARRKPAAKRAPARRAPAKRATVKRSPAKRAAPSRTRSKRKR